MFRLGPREASAPASAVDDGITLHGAELPIILQKNAPTCLRPRRTNEARTGQHLCPGGYACTHEFFIELGPVHMNAAPIRVKKARPQSHLGGTPTRAIARTPYLRYSWQHIGESGSHDHFSCKAG